MLEAQAFGDLELVHGRPRELGARAAEDSTVLYLRSETLQHAADAIPSLSLAMSRTDDPKVDDPWRWLPWRRR